MAVLPEQFPWNTPSNAESIQQLLYRLAMLATIEGAATSPGVRAWGAFQQTVKGGGSYTTIKNVSARQVLISNSAGVPVDISQDGINYFILQNGIENGDDSVTINVKENAAEIKLKKDDNSAGDITVSILYFT